MNKIIWLISVSITSFLGYIKLKMFSLKTDNKKWREVISRKKVLIVGTGPSLNLINEDYFHKFDVIVYLNHAVKISGKANHEFFFTTDIGVIKDIMNTNYYKNILKLGKSKSIVAPIFFQQFLFLNKLFIKNFSWISASNAKFIFFKRHLKFGSKRLNVNFPPSYWPEQLDSKLLEKWFKEKNQVMYFPVIETTSALSAILFFAKYTPKSINLIGCDFSDGRANVVKKTNRLNSTNVFNNAKENYKFIEGFLYSKGLDVNNDSWDIKINYDKEN